MHRDGWHDAITSGRARGPLAATARGLLGVASGLYGLGVRHVARGYDRGDRPVASVDVPVLSVGNLTAGGTGKTPVTAHFANRLRAVGRRVAVVSRGYRPLPDDPLGRNDEALVLESLCPGAVFVRDRDRAAGARHAITGHGADVILLDDGFQHRRLARDLDVVLIDATDPWGGDRLLPAGRLREPVTALARAGLVLITRVDAVDDARLTAIRTRVATLAPDVPIATVAFAPQWADGAAPAGRVGAFCGLGNPRAFAATLARLGVEPVRFEAFPDHHRYGPTDLARLAALARRDRLDAWVCTRKDAVKLDPRDFGDVALNVVDQEVTMREGGEQIDARLAEYRPQQVRRAA